MTTIKSRAGKIVCIGRNYVGHIKELNNLTPAQPFFFLKPQSSVLLPGAGPVLRPKGVILHHEVELAVVIGQEIRRLDHHNPQNAIDAIKGYAVGIDLTARNLQDEAKERGLPWTIAKGFDTFLPISNFIPKARIPNPHDVKLYLSLNGAMKQCDSTELMIFRIPQLLSAISNVMTLQKDDIVLTGTPKGVGPVVPGDVIRAGIFLDDQDIMDGRIEVTVQQQD
ncbi:MAG: hypothetical protein M1829_005714 [Trizodia sp. TS-e1964]|nr:MAG: hypothetical protein M1829_005714 [Trizodia sp. TS-e1964]